MSTAAYGQVSPKEIVRQSIENYQRDWRASRDAWTYTQKDVTEADGTKVVEVSEIIPLEGTPYERLVSKNGHSLSPGDQRKEDKKYEHALRTREKESPQERAERIRKYEGQRSFVKDIPEAYDFRLVGEEAVESRPAWVITMTPRAGFVPSTPHGALLAHIEGKLWIDKEDLQWARAEAHVSDTISIGWILARVQPGTKFTVEQTRVEDNLWMPRRITICGAAHVMLVHNKVINEELVYSGYRKAGSVSADKHAPVAEGSPAGQTLR
ncbi:MAG: hypothetical protein M3N93_00805 [Acidobacteriota bacterium]|nr:hypothetical protein [Acidobacteriota bacterium]